MSVKGTTGRIGMVPAHFKGNISRDLARIRTRKDVDPKFVFQMLQSDLAKHRLTVAAVGTTRMELSIAILKQVRIPLPPTKAEQEAIAEALSDADALIEALEQLIAKKRQVKQGAMQELLHPQDDWILATVAELAGGAENIVDGPFGSNLKNSDYVASGIPVLQGLNITHDQFVWKEVRYISRKKAKDLYRSNARVGDLLTVKIGSIGFSAIIDDLDGNNFAIIPANLLRTRIQNPNTDALFVYYLLTSNAAKKKLRDLAGNTAQPAIGLTGFRNLSFAVPTSRKEQTAIVEILSDMDAEIAALEAKLAKARQVKQGMMSELLAGRVRLV
ncbi:MAG TPA: restriction endonuclease subunit S [Anaerolineales bacterium]|nr:restriction endonuclease subunit S [Anaerolineales bacterium]